MGDDPACVLTLRFSLYCMTALKCLSGNMTVPGTALQFILSEEWKKHRAFWEQAQKPVSASKHLQDIISLFQNAARRYYRYRLQPKLPYYYHSWPRNILPLVAGRNSTTKREWWLTMQNHFNIPVPHFLLGLVIFPLDSFHSLKRL